jgi:hypothetical protein
MPTVMPRIPHLRPVDRAEGGFKVSAFLRLIAVVLVIIGVVEFARMEYEEHAASLGIRLMPADVGGSALKYNIDDSTLTVVLLPSAREKLQALAKDADVPVYVGDRFLGNTRIPRNTNSDLNFFVMHLNHVEAIQAKLLLQR